MRNRLQKFLAAATSSLLILVGLSAPAFGNDIDEGAANAAELTAVPESVALNSLTRVPIFEAGLSDLENLVNGRIQVGELEADAVLLRISAYSPDENVDILVAGTPALSVSAGANASASVLAPIADGYVPVSATGTVDVRVEILLAFESNEAAPGSTIALEEPINRVNSREGIGLEALTSDPQTVSIVGLGGIPSQDVRAGYLTATLDLAAPGTVTVGGQPIPLPSGRSIVSTVAAVNSDGTVELASDVAGEISLDVRGWVVGSPQGLANANITGSYSPAAQAEWASEAGNGELGLDGNSDRSLSLALISAEGVGSGTGGYLEIGTVTHGRSRGILVDSVAGALPQLEVVEGAGPATVGIRGEATNVQGLLVGDFAGARTSTGQPISATIDGPDGGVADLTEVGTFVLSGTIDSGDTIERVEISADGAHIGNAQITYGPHGPTWSLQTAAPRAGTFNFTAEAFSRGGTTTSVSTSVDVVLPDSDEVVITDETVVIDPSTVESSAGWDLIFSTDPQVAPGDVMVIGVGEETPEGLLRRVLAVENVDGTWSVLTEQANITDVFLQVNIEAEEALLGPDTVVEPVSDVPEGTTVIDEGVENIEMIVDDEPVLSPFASAPRLGPLMSRSGPPTTYKLSTQVALAFEKDGPTQDLSRAKHAKKDQVKNQIRVEGGISVEASFLFEVSFVFELDIQVRWKWLVPVPELTHFKTGIEGETGADVELAVSAKLIREYKIQLLQLSYTPITIMAGPVPIVLGPELSVDYVNSISAEATLSISESWGTKWSRGVQYVDGILDDYSTEEGRNNDENNSCGAWAAAASVSGELGAKVGVELSTGVKLYGIVGPKIALEVSGEASFKVTGTTESLTADYQAAIVAAVSGKVEVGIKVFGVELGNLEYVLVRVEARRILKTDVGLPLSICSPSNPGGGGDGDGDGGEVIPADGTVTGSVVDAQTASPLGDVEVRLRDADYKVTKTRTAADGTFRIAVPAGSYDLQVNQSGYIPYSVRIQVPENDNLTVNVGLSEQLAGQEYRAVLTWGEYPRDLDSHLLGQSTTGSFHTYFGQKVARAFDSSRVIAQLDVDDTTSYGPETTTFEVDEDGNYLFFVHNWSGNYGGNTLATSGARVAVYRGSERIATFRVPAGIDESRYWTVFRISEGHLIPVNQLGEQPTDVWDAGARSVQTFGAPSLPQFSQFELDEVSQEIAESKK